MPQQYRLGSFILGSPLPSPSASVHPFNIIPSMIWKGIGLTCRENAGEGLVLYHGVNLLFHLLAAVMAWRAGREVLRLLLSQQEAFAERASFLGAMVFAVHPLCSEPVNYAKCLNSLTVVVFALFSVCHFVRWQRLSLRRDLVLGMTGWLATTMSYFPGAVLLSAWLAVLAGPALTSMIRGLWQRWRRQETVRRWLTAGGALVCLGFAGWWWGRVIHESLTFWLPLQGPHFLTQGRVIWEYLGRMLWPGRLCSDHFFLWSYSWSDTQAVALLTGIMSLSVLAFLCAFRRQARLRLWGVIASLLLAPLVIRFLYVNLEAMVEYRAYPSIPWFGLAAGCAMAWLMGKWKSPVALLLPVLVVAPAMLVSMRRTSTWESRELLCEDVLSQYPDHPRAILQLELDYSRYGETRFEEVMALHNRLLGVANRAELRDARGRGMMFTQVYPRIYDSARMVIFNMAEKFGSRPALEWADATIMEFKGIRPQDFETHGREIKARAWPLLFAKEEVQRTASEVDQRVANRKRAIEDMRRKAGKPKSDSGQLPAGHGQ